MDVKKVIEKVSALLDEKYSMHEADYLYNLICDDTKTTEDILNFDTYVVKCGNKGVDTDIDAYERSLTNEKN